MNSDQQLIKHYNIAYRSYFDTYIGKNRYPSNRFRLDIVHHFIKVTSLNKKTASILEAGCGGGHVTLSLLKSGYVKVKAFDLSEEMVKQAKSILSEAKEDPSIVTIGDVNKMDFPDISFDLTLLLGIIPNVENPHSVLEEAYRVIKPDGYLICHFSNQLFSLFTINNYTLDLYYDFFKRFGLRNKDINDLINKIKKEIPISTGYVSKIRQIKNNQHNPLEIDAFLKKYGFKKLKMAYYHYHPFPPRFAENKRYQKLLQDYGIKLETVNETPYGLFSASAFVVLAQKK